MRSWTVAGSLPARNPGEPPRKFDMSAAGREISLMQFRGQSDVALERINEADGQQGKAILSALAGVNTDAEACNTRRPAPYITLARSFSWPRKQRKITASARLLS